MVSTVLDIHGPNPQITSLMNILKWKSTLTGSSAVIGTKMNLD